MPRGLDQRPPSIARPRPRPPRDLCTTLRARATTASFAGQPVSGFGLLRSGASLSFWVGGDPRLTSYILPQRGFTRGKGGHTPGSGRRLLVSPRVGCWGGDSWPRRKENPDADPE